MSNPLPPAVQAILDRQAAAASAAPAPAPPATAPAAPAPTPTGAEPPPFNPSALPSIPIPDQSKKTGPEFLPWNEPWCADVTLHTIKNKPPGSRCGPRFEAVFTVDTVHLNCGGNPMVPTTQRALPWFYTPEPIYDGKVRDATKAALGRFGEFVAGVLGQSVAAPGFDVNARASELVALSEQVPSLGIKLRLANVQNGVSKTTGKVFWKQTVQLI